jgi:glutathione S-transferase
MKLYANLTSPYGRVVRMAIEELRLSAQIEFIVAQTRVPECEVNEFVPTGKIPMLVSDDGHFFNESRFICQYLDTLHDPLEADRAFEGTTTGFLDGVSVWVREVRRPHNEQSPGILEQERARVERCLRWLEDRVDTLGASGDRIDYPRLCVGVTLWVIDERLNYAVWRELAPGLANWYQGFCERPSFLTTRA